MSNAALHPRILIIQTKCRDSITRRGKILPIFETSPFLRRKLSVYGLMGVILIRPRREGADTFPYLGKAIILSIL